MPQPRSPVDAKAGDSRNNLRHERVRFRHDAHHIARRPPRPPSAGKHIGAPLVASAGPRARPGRVVQYLAPHVAGHRLTFWHELDAVRLAAPRKRCGGRLSPLRLRAVSPTRSQVSKSGKGLWAFINGPEDIPIGCDEHAAIETLFAWRATHAYLLTKRRMGDGPPRRSTSCVNVRGCRRVVERLAVQPPVGPKHHPVARSLDAVCTLWMLAAAPENTAGNRRVLPSSVARHTRLPACCVKLQVRALQHGVSDGT